MSTCGESLFYRDYTQRKQDVVSSYLWISVAENSCLVRGPLEVFCLKVQQQDDIVVRSLFHMHSEMKFENIKMANCQAETM